MVVHDLRCPMGLCFTVETEAHPLELLAALKDRTKAVMLTYVAAPHTCKHSFVWFNPETGEHGFADALDGQEAYELAQAEYQRDTHPAGSTTH